MVEGHRHAEAGLANDDLLPQLNWETNELGVLDKVLQPAHLEELGLILLQAADHPCAVLNLAVATAQPPRKDET